MLHYLTQQGVIFQSILPLNLNHEWIAHPIPGLLPRQNLTKVDHIIFQNGLRMRTDMLTIQDVNKYTMTRSITKLQTQFKEATLVTWSTGLELFFQKIHSPHSQDVWRKFRFLSWARMIGMWSMIWVSSVIQYGMEFISQFHWCSQFLLKTKPHCSALGSISALLSSQLQYPQTGIFLPK